MYHLVARSQDTDDNEPMGLDEVALEHRKVHPLANEARPVHALPYPFWANQAPGVVAPVTGANLM